VQYIYSLSLVSTDETERVGRSTNEMERVVEDGGSRRVVVILRHDVSFGVHGGGCGSGRHDNGRHL